MGKTLKFFKSLLGFKTTDSPPSNSEPPDNQLKRRWSFTKSRRGKPGPVDYHKSSQSIDESSIHYYKSYTNDDPNKHAIALAVATAAVVDAAAAAAQVAAEMVRMTGGTVGYGGRDELAAIKIQSCFRGYLARRALRALKALVKLQAVVRGHILRKQTADMMRRLQALIRAQARARVLRSRVTGSATKTPSHFHHHHGPPTTEKVKHFRHTKHDHRSMSKKNSSRSYVQGVTDQERMFFDGWTNNGNDNIVEADTDESHLATSERKRFQPDQISFWHSQSLTTSRGSTFHLTSSSPCASCEMNSYDDSMRRVSTPIKSSDGSRSCINSYSNHPNYMAKTESSKAKVRSLSAPRIRSQDEVSNATKRVSGKQQVLTTHDSFANKTYNSGSGRLDQLGLHVYNTEESDFCDGYWI